MGDVTRHSKKHDLWAELARALDELAEAELRVQLAEAKAASADAERGRLAERAEFSVERQQRLSDEHERLLLLVALARDIAALDIDRILAATTQKIPYILRARGISVYLYDEERRTLALKDHNHKRKIDPLVELGADNSSLMALAVQTRRTLIVSDVASYPERRGIAVRFPNRERYGTPSCLVAPMLAGDKVLGVINLADRFDGRPFDRADRDTIDHAAGLIALALENAHRIARLRAAVPLDPLCGVRNHRAFLEILAVEVKRARRYKAELALIVLDFDGFGAINGNYGQAAGDAVLAQAARLLAGSVRDVDVVARVGGDEFAVILPEQSIKGALVVAERLEAVLSAHRFRAGAHTIAARATFGLTQASGERDHSELCRLAAVAIAEARRQGDRIGIKT